ncbi:uncharacterized protein V1513DRAFT_443855 [Lipomyces chichibuensis]|uniref:uncharacterized protein n=1 Tax=Lipomyces chichibuensis TaxID=1546026 RepID=UPI003342EE72
MVAALGIYLLCIFGGATIVWAIYFSTYCSDIELSLPLSSNLSHTSPTVRNVNQRLDGELTIKRVADKSSLCYKICRDVLLVLLRLGFSVLSVPMHSGMPSGWRNKEVASFVAGGVRDATKSWLHDACTIVWKPVKSILSCAGGAALPLHDGNTQSSSSSDQWVASPAIAVMILTILIPFRCLRSVFVSSAERFCEFLELLEGEYAAIPTHQLSKYPRPTQLYRRLDGSRSTRESGSTFKYTARYLPVEPYRRDAVLASVQSGFSASKASENMNMSVPLGKKSIIFEEPILSSIGKCRVK